jgi:hypothetical protein
MKNVVFWDIKAQFVLHRRHITSQLHGKRNEHLEALISVFKTGAATFLSSSSSFILARAEWTPFQTHCYSENLVAPGIEQPSSQEL